MTDPDSIKALMAVAMQVLADRDLCLLTGIEVPICLDDLAKAVANVEARFNQKRAGFQETDPCAGR